MSKTSKPSLLKDNSWIRKVDYEDENVEQDPNFGRTVLSRYKSNETLASPEGDEVKTTKTVTTSSSVQALSKRFSGSQDEFKSSSTLPSSKTTSSSTKYTYTSLKSDPPITTSKTIFTEEPKASTTTTTLTKNGNTETTITTTETVSSPVSKTSTKTETFTERVKSSSKSPQYSTYSPTRTTKVTETTVTRNNDAEDKLYDTYSPTPIKNESSPSDSKTSISKTETVIVKDSNDTKVEDKLYDTLLPKSMKDDFTSSKTTISSTETVTVKSSTDGDGFKTTTTTRTSSRADDPFDTYLPRVTTSSVSSPVSSSSVTKREIVTVESSSRGYSSYTDDIPSTRTTSYTISSSPSSDKTYSYSRPDSSYEYTSITSPSIYSSSLYRSRSRSDDILSDPIYSTSSIKSVYASPERTVLEKDMCTSCRKPFTGDAKIVLDEMKINCHASCFKCEVCNNTLGHLKAGDSMWIYKRLVHCENCFEVTRAKWRQ